MVFTGGSAFGLATADGVMHHLAAQSRGCSRAPGRCRSCPRPRSSTSRSTTGERPGAAEGAAAAAAAESAPDLTLGSVGAGRGAPRRHVAGRRSRGGGRPRQRECARRGGHGRRARGGERGRRRPRPRRRGPRRIDRAPRAARRSRSHSPTSSTRRSCSSPPTRCSRSRTASCSPRPATTAWPGRCEPSHTRFDGDLVVAVATGVVEAHLDRLRVATAEVVAEAVRSAVRAN